MISIAEDLTNRYADTFVKVTQGGETVAVRVHSFVLKLGVDGRTEKIEDLNINYDINNRSYSRDCNECTVDLRSPASKFINLDGEAVYLAKSGERHFKKGFTLDSVGDGKRMYTLLNPLAIRMKMLETLNPDWMFDFGNSTPFIQVSSPAKEIDYTSSNRYQVANRVFFPEYDKIKEACEFLEKTGMRSRAISKSLAIALSSNADYPFELYSELFPFGYYNAEKKLFIVQPQYKQDILDYLNREKEAKEEYDFKFI